MSQPQHPSPPPPGPAPSGRPARFLSRLRVRLLLLVLVSILPALALLAWAAVEHRRAAIKEGTASALRLARLAALAQQQNIDITRQLLTTLAQLEAVKRRDAAECARLFADLIQIHPIYANIGAITPDGYLLAAAVPASDPVFLGDRAYFQRATNTLKFAVGEFQVGRITGKPTLNLALPVRDEKSGALGLVLFAALDLNWLASLAARSDLPEGSTVTVIDRNGVILVRYPSGTGKRSWIGESVAKQPGVAQFLARGSEFSGVLPGLDGVRRLYSSTPLSRTGGLADAHVFVGIPTRVAFATANTMLWQNLVFLGLVAALALGAAWIGGDYFVLRQVRALVTAARRISAGDLKARTGVEHGPGEIAQLAQAFDEMAASLEQRVSERERAQFALEALNQDLERRVAERTQELKRSNEDLEQFAYVASHDLQEPLRMVTNYLQLLQSRYKDKLDQPANDFIAFAADGASRMQRLINDLLAYSRVHTRGESFEPCDLEEVLRRVLLNLKLAIADAGAQIRHDPLPTVRGDAAQLGQLFQNLISNAIKFRGERKPEVTLRAERRDRPAEGRAGGGKEWLFSVQDNGIGIPPEEFQRVFMLFQRLHSRSKYPGTGIGLAICKKIVERHEGRIWLESKVGEGTTFFFTLPASD
ncbi:MAG TPA: ATP-binding protein [Methylomirabilota bacterium]|nr:ATP-binding protein [Methylomirabilota bacterium]